MFAEDLPHNYAVFRDCLGDIIIQCLNTPQKRQRRRATKIRKNAKGVRSSGTAESAPTMISHHNVDSGLNSDSMVEGEDLADFIEYIATEMFQSLPLSLRNLDHLSYNNNPVLSTMYTEPLPSSTVEPIAAILPLPAIESLVSYVIPQAGSGILITESPSAAVTPLLTDILTSYISATTKAPPPPSSTRPESNACEICARTQLPLTYHHLIPRSVHAKALKRNWHPKEKLDDVAWLCRACHSFVHRCASNEELAREWFTVDRLLDRDDVQAFVGWIGKVRWKAR